MQAFTFMLCLTSACIHTNVGATETPDKTHWHLLVIQLISISQSQQPSIDAQACIACNSKAMLSGAALGAAEKAAACCFEQSAKAELHDQAGTQWEKAAPDQQLQIPTVKATLLPPATVPSDCSPPADWLRPAMSADAVDDMAADPVTAVSPQGQKGLRLSSVAAQQSAHQGLNHPDFDGVKALPEHTAERDRSAALASDSKGASAAAPAASQDIHTTAVSAAVLAGNGDGYKWHFEPGSNKLLIEIDISVIHHSGQISAALAHAVQAVKGLPSVLCGRGPIMHTTESARWISQSPCITATQAASPAEVSSVLSSALLASVYGRAIIRGDSKLALDDIWLEIVHPEVCYQAAHIIAIDILVCYCTVLVLVSQANSQLLAGDIQSKQLYTGSSCCSA